MAKTVNDRIEAMQAEIREKEAQISKLKKQQKERERKDRTHRFCTRGGIMERLLPDLAIITDEQFKSFVERTMQSNYGVKILRELAPQTDEVTDEPNGNTDVTQSGVSAAPVPAGTTERTEPAPAPTSTETAAHNEVTPTSKPTETTARTNPAPKPKPTAAPSNNDANTNIRTEGTLKAAG